MTRFKRVFGFRAMALVLCLSISGCGGLTVPSRVSASLAPELAESELHLDISLLAGELVGCDSYRLIEVTRTAEADNVFAEIHGHDPVSNEPDECPSSGYIEGEFELGTLDVGDVISLEISMGDDLSVFEIGRTKADLVTIKEVTAGNVSLSCFGSSEVLTCDEIT